MGKVREQACYRQGNLSGQKANDKMKFKITHYFSFFRGEKQHKAIVRLSNPGKNEGRCPVSYMASRNVSVKEALKLLHKKTHVSAP